jgi:GTP diphosphokinase / guanosine-3',5'-bis(diphosphate) 3'-diphosphatase
MQIQSLLNKIKKKNPDANLELIRRAYDFAVLKHDGQKRLSGEAYINHPLEVASILVDLDLDEDSIAAALLHDVIEDTDATKEEIGDLFGTKIAELVDGVTRLGTIDFSKLPSEEIQEAKFHSMIEDLRKFFLAMAKDIRVVIIKLADRLHNMRTLDALTPANQKRIARETLEIFAPLADRLGMGSMKAELEDLAFKYSNPSEYRRIVELISRGEKERKHYLSKIKKFIQNELTDDGIQAEIDGRVKHIYSIYKKLQKVHGDISEIYDIMAIRIIVDSVEDCYRVLGIIHKHFKPLIYRIKDYISVPKPNGYQSLHTTVFGLDGNITEIQIRTKEMHEEAENGVAAHWHYSATKEKVAYRGKASFASENNLKWVNQITDLQKNVTSSAELAESLNIDFFNDRIFINSPSGDVFELPDGATPVDFAYEVHTQVGHRCRGAKVNGKIANLDQKLHNRDMVEVILAPKNDQSGPPRGWLEFVVTAKAKQNIRSWYKHLNKDVNIEAGHKLLAEELSLFDLTEENLSLDDVNDVIGNAGWKTWDDVLAAIGDGTVTPRLVVKKIVGQKLYQILDEKKAKAKKAVVVEKTGQVSNLDGILIRYADCCKPKKGDTVKGFITQGKGITIHRADCRNLLTSPQEKVIDVNFDQTDEIEMKVEIRGLDRVGFIRDITDVVSNEKINIVKIDNKQTVDEGSIINLVIKTGDPARITDLLPKLRNVQGVSRVRKQ